MTTKNEILEPLEAASPLARRGGFPVGRLVLGAIALGFFALLGVRLVTATKEKKTMAAERAQSSARALADAKAPLSLEVVRARPATWTPTVNLDGTLRPYQDSELGFKAGGQLAALRVAVGQHVKKGEVLAQLDRAQAEAQQRAAAGQLKAAEAQLALATDAARRTDRLLEKQASAEAAGVQAQGQRQLAEAQVEVARAQLALATSALADHTLRAPFSGVVTKVPDGTGGVVAPGVPLFHLQDTDELKLSGTVSPEDAALVRVGAKVEFVDGNGQRAAGTVTAVLPSVDTSTRRVPVEAVVRNDDGKLRGNTFVRAMMAGGTGPVDVLRLPSTALRPGSQDELVVVEGGRTVVRHVSFVMDQAGDVLVRRGLGPDEDVVRAPSSELKEGVAVQARHAATQPAAESGK